MSNCLFHHNIETYSYFTINELICIHAATFKILKRKQYEYIVGLFKQFITERIIEQILQLVAWQWLDTYW